MGARLKAKRASEIEQILIDAYGQKSLITVSDLDRPFTAKELANFAKDRLVCIGTHTRNHAILTNYKRDEMKTEIEGAPKEINDLTGKRPIIISYPNGNYNTDVIQVCKESGIKLAVTVLPIKNYLPIDFETGQNLRLGRFLPEGGKSLLHQCEAMRSDFSVYNSLKMWRNGQKC